MEVAVTDVAVDGEGEISLRRSRIEQECVEETFRIFERLDEGARSE